ncbi:unnamed protein product [Pleuronectes platessa]|uniref:Uncharacterized protein n=1 Tax=Pleuronectes platessa TaxID=8262 RepID=A0A9N7TXJ4_PLEPL|nr:unnamed protein product [Pleuronectes platessa]
MERLLVAVFHTGSVSAVVLQQSCLRETSPPPKPQIGDEKDKRKHGWRPAYLAVAGQVSPSTGTTEQRTEFTKDTTILGLITNDEMAYRKEITAKLLADRPHHSGKGARDILPATQDIYHQLCLRKAHNIIKDYSHPASRLFTLLPPGPVFCVRNGYKSDPWNLTWISLSFKKLGPRPVQNQEKLDPNLTGRHRPNQH